MSVWRSFAWLYWSIVGALVGVGILGLPSIGSALLAAGLILIVIGIIGNRSQIWAACIGLGGAPLILLLRQVIFAPPPCSSIPSRYPFGTTGMPCGSVPAEYIPLMVGFGVIALLGCAWPLLIAARRRLASRRY